jgi:hypothetical protein
MTIAQPAESSRKPRDGDAVAVAVSTGSGRRRHAGERSHAAYINIKVGKKLTTFLHSFFPNASQRQVGSDLRQA